MGLVPLFVPWNPRTRIDEPPSPTGDSYDSSGILKFQSAIEEMHPGIFIHSVYVDPDTKKDMHATMVRSEHTGLFSSTTFSGGLTLTPYGLVRKRR
jgi:hypothetical protein